MRQLDTEKKRLRGTYRPDRDPATGRAAGRPRPPRGFRKDDPAAWSWWRQLIDIMPWLTEADGPALLLLSRHMARADEATAEMSRGALVTRDGAHGGDLKQSPAALVWSRESAAAARLLKELGATVAGRGARPATNDEEASIADLLFSLASDS